MNKKTLYIISCFTTRSGYGVHSRACIRALLSIPKVTDNFNIKLISTRWGATPQTALDPNKPEDKVLLDLITPNNQIAEQPDVSIQISIPSEAQRIGKTSILITAGTEASLAPFEFVNKPNEIDFLIVPSEFTKNVLIGTKYDKKDARGQIVDTVQLKKPVEVLFEGIDTGVFQKTAYIESKLSDQLKSIPEKFNFLAVGHWLQGNFGQDRKDISGLVYTFLKTFAKKKVKPGLILKTSGAGFSITERDQIIEKINQIQEMFREQHSHKGSLPNIYLINGDLTDEQMNELYNHPKVKALVSFHKAEGFCTLPGTKIITQNGLKPIEDITLDDYVYTHKGRFRKVTKLMNRIYDGEIINITPTGCDFPVSLTADHNVYVCNRKTNEYSWIPAKELTVKQHLVFPFSNEFDKIKSIKISDYLEKDGNIFEENGYLYYKHSNKISSHILINNELELNADFGKIVGYYLSEGTVSNGQIVFSIHQKELETIGEELKTAFKNVFGIDNFSIWKHETKKSAQIKFSNQIVCKFLLGFCGHLARKKRLPKIIYQSNKEFACNVLSSVLIGDGSLKNNLIRIQLVNTLLIKDLKILSLKLGIPASYNMKILENGNEAPRIGWGELNNFNKLAKIINNNHDFVNIEYRTTTSTVNRAFKLTFNDESCLIKNKSISTSRYGGLVYNLSVDEDETYCTDLFVIHNCLPLLEFTTTGKPVICSNYSGPVDFLNPEYSFLLPGKLTKIDPSAANEWLPKEGEWFSVSYDYAGQVLKDCFENYDKYLEKSRKSVKFTKDNFSIEKMSEKFLEILEKYNIFVESEPTQMKIRLPELKKIT